MSAIRNDNEIIVVFDDDRTVETPPLFQYDKGIIIEFKDVPDLVDVQFSSIYTNETINKTIIDGKVTIPDSLLEELSGIVAYIKYINANSEWTEKVLSIPIKQRQKPSDYITEEDEPSFRADMQAIMEETKEIAEEAKKAIENLELSEEQINEIASKIDLVDYVKTNTKVANRPLTQDITPAQIAQEIMNDSNAQNTVTSGVDYFLMGGKGSLQTNNKTNYVKAINEVNALAKQNQKAIENFDLSNFYNKTEIDDKFADLEYLESEDLLDRVRIYTGTSAPLRATSRYPDVKVGDIYINTNETDHFYMAIIISGSAMTWASVPNVSGLFKDIYNKKEVDSMFSSYDTSEEVDEKIKNATPNVDLSEYTKIWSGTEPPVNGVASNYEGVKSGDIYITPTGAFYRANVTSNKLYVSWIEIPISAEVIKKFVAKEYPTSGYNVGDIFIDENNSYKARVRTNTQWVQLAYLEEVNAILRSYYNKTETEEVIQTAITEALNNIPIAEGSEF